MSGYRIEYVGSNHWAPELPRIVDPAGKSFAICDDIDAADIILQALNDAPATSSTGVLKQIMAEYDAAKDDACFEDGHPIFKMAEEIDRLQAENEALKQQAAEAEREASGLAMNLWKRHYKNEAPEFELCDTTAGIITQIDNMVCTLVKPSGVVISRKCAQFAAYCIDAEYHRIVGICGKLSGGKIPEEVRQNFELVKELAAEIKQGGEI